MSSKENTATSLWKIFKRTLFRSPRGHRQSPSKCPLVLPSRAPPAGPPPALFCQWARVTVPQPRPRAQGTQHLFLADGVVARPSLRSPGLLTPLTPSLWALCTGIQGAAQVQSHVRDRPSGVWGPWPSPCSVSLVGREGRREAAAPPGVCLQFYGICCSELL